MTVNNELHEMENQVTRGAKAADPMPKAPNYVPDAGSIENLGGPTPQNSNPTDDSNKMKTPSASFAQSGDVQFKGASGKVQLPGPAALKASGYGFNQITPLKDNLIELLKKTKFTKFINLYDSGRGANEEVDQEEEEVIAETEELEDQVEETPEEEEEELDLEEDVKALLEGEELSEEFQDKAKTVFEAAVRSKIASLKEALENRFASALVEQVETIKSELTERVDSYLEYVSNEWINENKLQVETGLRGELSESFMTGLKNLFEEHYVEIPEEKYNVLEAMVEKLDEMETKLNEQIDTNIALTKRLSESVSDNILDEVSEGLALSQKEKLASLAEGVEFDSEEQYREKLVTLREAYFASKPVTNSQEVISEEAIADDVSPAMAAYLNALTKFN